MTPDKIQELDQRLKQWRDRHPNTESVRAAYRREVLNFTRNSMALENEPINPQRLAKLLGNFQE